MQEEVEVELMILEEVVLEQVEQVVVELEDFWSCSRHC
jgi:hypothetical protein